MVHRKRLQIVEHIAEHTDKHELVLESDPDVRQLYEVRIDLGGGYGRLGQDDVLELIETRAELQLQGFHILGACDYVVHERLEADLVLANVDERVGEQLARHVAELVGVCGRLE